MKSNSDFQFPIQRSRYIPPPGRRWEVTVTLLQWYHVCIFNSICSNSDTKSLSSRMGKINCRCVMPIVEHHSKSWRRVGPSSNYLRLKPVLLSHWCSFHWTHSARWRYLRCRPRLLLPGVYPKSLAFRVNKISVFHHVTNAVLKFKRFHASQNFFPWPIAVEIYIYFTSLLSWKFPEIFFSTTVFFAKMDVTLTPNYCVGQSKQEAHLLLKDSTADFCRITHHLWEIWCETV